MGAPSSPTAPTPCDFFDIPSQTPINELNGVYHPNSSPPPGCPTGDSDCDPLSNYPCQGGLYLNNSNQQPAQHLTDGMNFAAQIYPRKQNGDRDDTNGKIVLLSMGMCNAWSKFGHDLNSFVNKLCPSAGGNIENFCAPGPPTRDNSLNSHLVVVNGAQPGADGLVWQNINSSAWSTLWTPGNPPMGKLADAGVSPKQVQAVWCEHALAISDPNCTNNCDTSLCTTFPPHAYTLREAIEQTLRNIRIKFPNCQLVYISPRAYAYTLTFHNPEPKAYQTGFADKWVILDQLQGNGNIGYDVAPWIAWGPYIWTDGTNPRSDGLIWRCNQTDDTMTDIKSDLVHPSTNGVDKVSNQLIAFFKTDPTTTSWFLRPNDTDAHLTATLTPHLPATISVGSTVHFTAAATSNKGTIASYLWAFDDGESTSTSAIDRDFKVPGTYSIHFAAIDSAGNNIQRTGSLTVTP